MRVDNSAAIAEITRARQEAAERDRLDRAFMEACKREINPVEFVSVDVVPSESRIFENRGRGSHRSPLSSI